MIIMNHMKNASLIFIISITLFGCAGQRPPEGGPLDKTPPEIISVYPEPNTVNFSDAKIVLEFSEYVDRRSVEEAIFISPSIENIEFDWSGTEVELHFMDPLRKNTTYVFTVGTDVVDYRNRNPMAKAVTIAFSTGEKIDNGAITGMVYDENPQGIMIFSYRKNDIAIDTLNPMTSKPDYITQAGKDGSFALTNLATGSYRLFAVRDEYRNLLYDPEIDGGGTTGDVTITETDTVKRNVKFIIAKEDTTSPRIAAVSAPDNRHLVVEFSEPMDSLSISADKFVITDTTGRTALTVQSIFSNSAPLNSYSLITDPQGADSIYVLTIDSVSDKSGYSINELARQKRFNGSRINDTIPPSLVYNSISSATSKILPEQFPELRFSDHIVIANADSAVQLFRVKDSSLVDHTILQNTPTSILVQPKKKLFIDERYRLNLRYGTISDLFGNRYVDSTGSFEFTTDDPERYGSIEGNFAGLTGTAPKVVVAKNVSDKKQVPVMTVVDSRGKFAFPLLPEGQYALKVFDDRNNNRIHDAGRLYPYRPAEDFILCKDTIRVRPRWPVDGVFIRE